MDYVYSACIYTHIISDLPGGFRAKFKMQQYQQAHIENPLGESSGRILWLMRCVAESE